MIIITKLGYKALREEVLVLELPFSYLPNSCDVLLNIIPNVNCGSSLE